MDKDYTESFRLETIIKACAGEGSTIVGAPPVEQVAEKSPDAPLLGSTDFDTAE